MKTKATEPAYSPQRQKNLTGSELKGKTYSRSTTRWAAPDHPKWRKQLQWCTRKSCAREEGPQRRDHMEYKGDQRRDTHTGAETCCPSSLPPCPFQVFRGSGILLWQESKSKLKKNHFLMSPFNTQSNSYLQFRRSLILERSMDFKDNSSLEKKKSYFIEKTASPTISRIL